MIVLSFPGGYNSHIRSPETDRRDEVSPPPSNGFVHPLRVQGYLHKDGSYGQITDTMHQMGNGDLSGVHGQTGPPPPDDPPPVNFPHYEQDSDYHGLDPSHHAAHYVENSPEFYSQQTLLENKYSPHYAKNVSRGEDYFLFKEKLSLVFLKCLM